MWYGLKRNGRLALVQWFSEEPNQISQFDGLLNYTTMPPEPGTTFSIVEMEEPVIKRWIRGAAF